MKKSVSLLLATICVGYAVPSFALESSYEVEALQRPAKWWTNLTVGRGVKSSNHIKHNNEIGSVMSFNGAFTDHLFATVYNHHVGAYDNDETNDRGAMVGYRQSLKKGYYSISSGLSYFNKKEPKYTYDTKLTEGVGVPLQIQAFWTPFKHVGFGVTTHGMFGKVNYASLTLGMQVYS